MKSLKKKKSGTTSEFHYFAIRFHSCDVPPLAFTNHHAIETLDEMSSKTLMITL